MKRRPLFAIRLVLLGLAVLGGPLRASSTQIWELSQYSDFLTGKLKRIALDREGRLRAAPELSTVYKTDQSVIWTIVEDSAGVVYFGTGHQGAVFSVSQQGKGKQLWKAPEIEVFALALGPDGLLYAGTSPNGKVYRLDKSGEAEPFFDPGETYIWSLVFDRGGGLLVGAGDKGKIYRVDRDGNGELWFDSGQRHVMSLALDAEGRLLAGTDPAGILYRVESPRSAFALYDSDLPEIRSIAAARDGAIYFAAMGGGMERMLQSVQAAQAAAQQAAAPQSPAVKAGAAPAQAAAAQTSATVSFAQPTVSYGLERAAVLRLQPGRAVEKLWSSTEENVLGLLLKDAPGSQAVFAGDRGGRIYEIDPRRRLSIAAQTDRPQITAMLQTAQGVLLGSAHGGDLLRLANEPAPSGVFETAAYDSGGVSRWGRLSWQGTTPEGASIAVRTRSGNSYRPDATWSPWSAAAAEAEDAAVASPAARFIQWQATLTGGAVLDSVRLTYLPQNSRPVVKSISVLPEAADTDAANGAKPAVSDTTSSYSITVSASGSVSAPVSSTKALELGRGPRRKLAVSWQAEDPDGDALRAAVAFRGEGETVWKTIERNIDAAKLTIDSDALADGRYRFRVTVDDGGVNPADRALTDEKIGAPVVIDHTPPRVRLAADETDAGAGIRFEATDATSNLHSAAYAIDAGEWRPLNADDGVIDSKKESFTVKPSEKPGGGEHLIVLRVRDRAGNAGLGKALLRQ